MRSLQRDPLYLEFVHFYMIIYVHLYLSIYSRGGQGHLKRQENRAVLAWRGAASAGLVSSADRAYMKAPVPRPTLRLVDKVSRSCGHTPGKVAGQRATVKAEMNGVTPGLDRRPPSR